MLSEDNTRRYTEPPRLDEAGLVAFLATQKDIVAAYLFTARPQRRAATDSDVAMAFLLSGDPDPQRCADRQVQLADNLPAFTSSRLKTVALSGGLSWHRT